MSTLAGFARRRRRASLATGLAVVAIGLLLWARSATLRPTAYVSGWLLLALVVFLASYNVRKKLTYPPLLDSATWMQLHAYGGVLSIAVFGFHTGLRLPDGPFETTLALLFAGVAISGGVGLFLSRAVPPRLAHRGREVLWERIPALRREARERAEQLVIDGCAHSGNPTLADFYARHLAHYFAGPRHFGRHWLQSRGPVLELLFDLDHLHRYLDETERSIAADLADLIRAKDDLDYHHAMQSVLKGWLFVHIPLTYALLVFLPVHVVLVHAFAGSV